MAIIPDEMSANLENDKIELAVSALRQLKEKETPDRKSILEDENDEKILLQLSLKRIPKLNHFMALRLNLMHSVVVDPKNICLFVKDRDTKKREYEEDVAYWREYLEEKDIVVGEIIPYKQLRTEFKTHEAKRNLCNGFDFFVVDASLSPLMPASLGKSFVKQKKMPYGINMDKSRVKGEFDRALRKTTMNVTGKGNVCCCQIGFWGQSDEKLIENIKIVAHDIGRKLPGGWKNVHSLHLRTPTLIIAIPIYEAFHSADEVMMPKLMKEGKEAIVDEVNTLTRSKVKVQQSGNINLIVDEPEDPLELQHNELRYENHLLLLNDVSDWKKKKGRKNLPESETVRVLKIRANTRRNYLEKLKQKVELQEEANFKEAEALKTVQKKKKKKPTRLPEGLNPFTEEGEKFIKKTIWKEKTEGIENNSGVEGKNKKKKIKIKPKKFNLNIAKKVKKEPKSSEISVVADKKKKVVEKTSILEKMSKNKRKKLRRSQSFLNETGTSSSVSNTPNKVVENTIVENLGAKNGGILRSFGKKFKKETKGTEQEIVVIQEKTPPGKRSLTSNLPKLGSLKKKSYKLNSEVNAPKSAKRGQNEPLLLSLKSNIENSTPKTKSPIQKNRKAKKGRKFVNGK